MEAIHHFLDKQGIKIPYYTWPVGEVREVLVFVHGLKSHAGWFLETGAAFAEKGIKVYAFDRRGSGKSQTRRGHIEDYRFWLEDIGSVIDLARRENPGHIPHLLGHCFGAKLALAYTIGAQNSINSLTLIAPPQFSLKTNISFIEKCKVLMTLISGKEFTVCVPIRDDMFTRNPEKNRFIQEDMLRLQTMTTRFCLGVLKIDRIINKNLDKISIPTLILLARDDDVVDNRRITKKLLPRLGSPKKEIKIFDCYHHLFFEPYRKEVLENIVKWIKFKGTCQIF